jgi:hypothetical protein
MVSLLVGVVYSIAVGFLVPRLFGDKGFNEYCAFWCLMGWLTGELLWTFL